MDEISLEQVTLELIPGKPQVRVSESDHTELYIELDSVINIDGEALKRDFTEYVKKQIDNLDEIVVEIDVEENDSGKEFTVIILNIYYTDEDEDDVEFEDELADVANSEED